MGHRVVSVHSVTVTLIQFKLAAIKLFVQVPFMFFERQWFNQFADVVTETDGRWCDRLRQRDGHLRVDLVLEVVPRGEVAMGRESRCTDEDPEKVQQTSIVRRSSSFLSRLGHEFRPVHFFGRFITDWFISEVIIKR